jgi:hypothetical protein
MAEAMRAGQRSNPRTPAEEAIVNVAVAFGWTDAAFDTINAEENLRTALAALAEGSRDSREEGGEAAGDYDFEEVLPALDSDTDVELLGDVPDAWRGGQRLSSYSSCDTRSRSCAARSLGPRFNRPTGCSSRPVHDCCPERCGEPSS